MFPLIVAEYTAIGATGDIRAGAVALPPGLAYNPLTDQFARVVPACRIDRRYQTAPRPAMDGLTR